MATLTRDQLLARKLGHETVQLEDGEVIVRPLTRKESIMVRGVEGEDLEERDNLIISLGMVKPQLTPEDVAQWAANDTAGELASVSMAIARISGMLPGAGKESYKSIRE